MGKPEAHLTQRLRMEAAILEKQYAGSVKRRAALLREAAERIEALEAKNGQA